MGTIVASAPSRIIETAGGEVVEGKLIELLAAVGADLQLLAFDGSQTVIASEIPTRDKVLRPISLSTPVREAVALPACLKETSLIWNSHRQWLLRWRTTSN